MTREPEPISSETGRPCRASEVPMAIEIWRRAEDGATAHLRP